MHHRDWRKLGAPQAQGQVPRPLKPRVLPGDCASVVFSEALVFPPQETTRLTMAEARDWAIHLLLTDVIMPGGSGPEVADRVKERCPDVKILYMSGYTGTAMAHQGILKSGSPLLQKPYSPDALLQKVREVLDEPRRRKA